MIKPEDFRDDDEVTDFVFTTSTHLDTAMIMYFQTDKELINKPFGAGVEYWKQYALPILGSVRQIYIRYDGKWSLLPFNADAGCIFVANAGNFKVADAEQIALQMIAIETERKRAMNLNVIRVMATTFLNTIEKELV